MTASMTIDQTGLSAGVAGRSRDDGLANGATVTLTSNSHGSTFLFQLMWVGQHPTPDTGSVGSLVVAGASTWTFTPTAGVYGTWRIKLTTDLGTADEDTQIRLFAIKQGGNLPRIPAANEVSNPSGSFINSGSTVVASSEFNGLESSGAFVSGTYVSWWRPVADVIYKFNTNLTASGDLTGTYPGPTVAKLNGRTVTSSLPTDGQVLDWDVVNAHWRPLTMSSSLVTNNSSVSGSTVTTALNNLYQRLDYENTSTASYSFALADVGKKKRGTSASAMTWTVVGTGSVAWVTGSVLYGRQVGAGQITITSGSGVTINHTRFKTTAQHSEFSLHYVGNNEWDLNGDLSA